MAAFRTYAQLIDETVERLSQVPGVGAQTYAETRIGLMIQHKFEVLFDEAWWSQFRKSATLTLTGTTGLPTTDVSTQTDPLRLFEDIAAIYAGTDNRPLARLPDTINPLSLSGTTPRFIEPSGSVLSIFKVWPITATGNVFVRFRSLRIAARFVSADIVDFDPQAIVLGTVYDYLEDDGTNPGATEKYKNMFESRVQQLKLSRANLPQDFAPLTAQSLSEWTAI